MSKWNENKLGELVTFSKGRLTHQNENFANGYMPLINADAVNGKSTLFSNTQGAVLCEANDVLMLWDGERSGLVTIGHNGVVGSTFSKIQNSECIDSKYLYYFLNYKFSWIQNNRTGTGVPHVPKDLGKILSLRYPEKKSEQQKIAQILSTTDSVIEKTQAAIAKYKAIKQGMLNDLFTRGIDIETGKLRPKQEDAPELYKESELNWIPRVWDEVESNYVVKFINGRAYSLHEWETTGIPVIRLQNLTGSGENYYYSNLELSENQYCNKGDLLYMWSATFGPHIWKGDKAIFHYHIWKVECSKKMNQTYFYYDLLRFTETVLNGSNGSTMAHITKLGMDKRSLNIPPIEEQVFIANRLLSTEKLLNSEKAYLLKLQSIKAGLMADLLSGKKLVPVPLEIAIQTT